MKPTSIFLCMLLSWTSKTVKPINAVRETAMGSRSPAGPRRLGTATRISASLSRRLSAFFENTPDQGQKAAKFAVLNPGHAGFPKRVERSEGSDTTPIRNARVSPCKPLCEILLAKASVYPSQPLETNVAAFVPEVLKAVRPMCWKRWYDCISCAFHGFFEDEKESRIKGWRRNRRSAQSLLPARLPAGRCFVGQPPAVRAALGPEM